MTDVVDEKFSLVIGGPFYRLQKRLSLLGPDLLPRWTTALLFVVIAWLPPGILSMLQGDAFSPGLAEGGFFLDYTAHVRFIIAIAALMAMERLAEGRIGLIVHQFLGANLFSSDERVKFFANLRIADRRASSNMAELCILILAYLFSFNAASVHMLTLGVSWLGAHTDDAVVLSWAGWWALLVSFPLFWFLVLRWFWRLVVWTMLLRSISRLKMRLVATHPDQCGGLGFLVLFPATFTMMIFALSCVTASVVLQEMNHMGLSLEMVGGLFVVWTLLVFAIFIGPLVVFAPLLVRLKIKALLDYGRLGTLHNSLFEQRWITTSEPVPEPLGTPDISSLADLGASFELIRSMNSVPVTLPIFRHLFLAAGLPWLVIVLTQIPLFELLSIVVQALL